MIIIPHCIPEQSSWDTMDLRSFRRVRRVRTDFLVNALQGTILNQFRPNLVCAYSATMTPIDFGRNRLPIVATRGLKPVILTSAL